MKKYFLAFGFNGYELEKVHMTLIYFGVLDRENLLEVTTKVVGYFQRNKVMSEIMYFNKIEMFGEANDVRVLRPSDTHNKYPLHELWLQLKDYRGGHLFEYNPHVTDEKRNDFVGQLNRLCLCSNDYEVLATWRLA